MVGFPENLAKVNLPRQLLAGMSGWLKILSWRAKSLIGSPFPFAVSPLASPWIDGTFHELQSKGCVR